MWRPSAEGDSLDALDANANVDADNVAAVVVVVVTDIVAIIPAACSIQLPLAVVVILAADNIRLPTSYIVHVQPAIVVRSINALPEPEHGVAVVFNVNNTPSTVVVVDNDPPQPLRFASSIVSAAHHPLRRHKQPLRRGVVRLIGPDNQLFKCVREQSARFTHRLAHRSERLRVLAALISRKSFGPPLRVDIHPLHSLDCR
jgi:chorismate mutase